MIVQQFRVWARTASPSRRADGASALARAYLYSNLDPAQRVEALDVMTALLDDPSPLVRRALAEAFANAADAPPHILLALADDQPSIASIVLARSPVLRDADLIDCATTASSPAQVAIASRPVLSPLLVATLAEVADADALATLARNAAVALPPAAIRRMVERHGDAADLRDALLGRSDLPATVRVELVSATARALTTFVTDCNWLSDERMKRVTHEAKDRAAIVIAGSDAGSPADLVEHLRGTGQLSVGFVFRVILSGKLELFKAVLAELSGVSLGRVDGLVSEIDSSGFAALYRKAGLPPELLPAIRIAVHAIGESDWTIARGLGLSRPVIERVLTACTALNKGQLDKLLVLLRRFEAEAARDEARAQCEPDATPPLELREPMPVSAEPLLLKDLDAADEPTPIVHAKHSGFRPARARLKVDLVAIEAQLRAA